MKNAAFHVDTRLARLLSENYRSSERAVKELVDNAWDADAEWVSVTLPESMTGDPVVVEDDGTGMTEEEIVSDYLYIASDRRQRRGERTPQRNRKVKGRKGIGKFAGLMAANTMNVETWAGGAHCIFSISIAELEASDDIEQLPISMTVSPCSSTLHGTRISLSQLRQNLAFPNADKFRQLLLQEYGREDGFSVFVNQKRLSVDDVQGSYTSSTSELPKVGSVKLRFTVADQKTKLKAPGITIRVSGKSVGKPDFFGLDESEDFPDKLLSKLYGEVEVDGLHEHVTADWGALIENSELYETVKKHIQPIIKKKVKKEYGREIQLAQARLQKKINDRLAALPEYKRKYADKSIKAVLAKYYGEPEWKAEPIVNVLLDALERTDYRAVLDYINEAKRSDIAKLAEALNEFGFAELAILAEQVKGRLEFLDRLEEVCQSREAKEADVHSALEKNLWIFGPEYSLFSSNQTLKRQVEEYIGQKYAGDDPDVRPDLLLSVDYTRRHLLVEFKRPSHTLRYTDYQQATRYRNSLKSYISNEIELLVIGGKKGSDLPDNNNTEPNTRIAVFDEVISRSRSQLNWLLSELGVEERA